MLAADLGPLADSMRLPLVGFDFFSEAFDPAIVGLVSQNLQGIGEPLNESLRQALQDPDVLRKFEVTGSSVYPADQQTSAAAQKTFLDEVKRLVSVLRTNNVVPE